MAESVLNSDVAAVSWAAAAGASAHESAQIEKDRPSKRRRRSRTAPDDLRDANTDDSSTDTVHEIDSFA